MKKIFFLFLGIALTGCTTMPYKCFPFQNKDKYTSVNAFCLADSDYHMVQDEKYSETYLKDFFAYTLNERVCSVEKHDYFPEMLKIFKYTDGREVSSQYYISVCEPGSLEKYHAYQIAEQERKQEETDFQNERISEIRKTEKLLGMKLCFNDDSSYFSVPSLLHEMDTVPKGCAFRVGWHFVVLGQSEAGTLITDIYDSSIRYLISKNHDDSELQEAKSVPDGYFENIGTHQYVNPYGAKSTIVKLKRLSYMK